MTKLLIFSFLFYSFWCMAQNEPQLEISSGHHLDINSLAYHPNGKLLASGGNDFQIILWDLAHQRQYKNLVGHSASIVQVAFNQAGDVLLSFDQNGELISWNIETGKKIQQRSTGGFAYYRNFFFGSSADFVYFTSGPILYQWNYRTDAVVNQFPVRPMNWQFASAKSGTVYLRPSDKIVTNLGVFSLVDGQEVSSIPFYSSDPMDLRMIRTNAKNNYAACGGMFDVFIFDLTGNKFLRKIKLPHPVSDLCFSADGNSLIVSMINENGIKVFDVISGNEKCSYSFPKRTLAGTISSGGISLAAHPTSQQVASPGKMGEVFSIDFFSTERMIKLGQLLPPTNKIQHVQSSNNGNYLYSTFTGEKSGVAIWDMSDGKIHSTILSAGKNLCAVNSETVAYVHQDTFYIKELPFASRSLLTFPSKKASHVALNADASLAFLFEEGESQKDFWGMSSPTFQVSVWKRGDEGFTFFNKIFLQENPSNFARLNPEGTYLFCLNAQMEVCMYDMVSGQRYVINLNFPVQRIQGFVPGTSQVILSGISAGSDGNTLVYMYDYRQGSGRNFNTGLKTFIEFAEVSPDAKTLAISAAHGIFDIGSKELMIQLFDLASGKLVGKLNQTASDNSSISWSVATGKIFSVSFNGTFTQWDAQTFAPELQFVSMNTPGDYILSDGKYYKSSKGNFKGISFRFKNKLYDFFQFDAYLNRPDLIMEKLKASDFTKLFYQQAVKSRTTRLGISAPTFSTMAFPELDLLNTANFPNSTDLENISVTYQTRCASLDKVQLYCNNVLLNEYKEVSSKVSVPLFSGNNTIEFMAIDASGLCSQRESFNIHRKSNVKPVLHLFAVGISTYKDSSHSLRFARKDAEDIINYFKSSSLFSNVEVHTAFDQEATLTSIKTFQNSISKVGKDDYVLMYYSAHGFSDPATGNTWLSTYETDFAKEFDQCFLLDSLTSLFQRCKSNTQLLFIDACSSGDKRKSKEKYMFSDVNTFSGLSIFTATSGDEIAKESAALRNGLFTYSVLEALKTKVADTNEDQKLVLSELYQYVNESVYRLSYRKQRPELRQFNELNDCVLR